MLSEPARARAGNLGKPVSRSRIWGPHAPGPSTRPDPADGPPTSPRVRRFRPRATGARRGMMPSARTNGPAPINQGTAPLLRVPSVPSVPRVPSLRPGRGLDSPPDPDPPPRDPPAAARRLSPLRRAAGQHLGHRTGGPHSLGPPVRIHRPAQCRAAASRAIAGSDNFGQFARLDGFLATHRSLSPIGASRARPRPSPPVESDRWQR